MAKGPSGGSVGGSQSAQVRASPHMSVARSQATGATASPARGEGGGRRGERMSHYPKIWERGGRKKSQGGTLGRG
ncbi:hypothetical protein Pyn_41191 [Prunus yedoensis var. nudiflora]|uniref:Uncharacterized protein n=1 Tax=Prunus yedoensis var. nudiflora TaxID=2094558 RepID=A0A314YGF9_PRUYE|nr:hypothetical protein Pyn_41191 [Prunus yedoensis var. nudiflora]